MAVWAPEKAMSQHGQVRFPRRATETGWWHSPGERYPAHTLTPWWRGERSGRRTWVPHAPRMPSGEWEFGNKQLIGRAIWTLFWQPVYLTVTPQPLGKFNYSDDKGAQLWFTTSGLWRCVQWPHKTRFGENGVRIKSNKQMDYGTNDRTFAKIS